ncbi:MAG: hypothetical protein II387_01335 [Oscillospiraceae bacterium]|nr:hypothetical protein [Oscillospiraceae bacterium]
MADYISNYTGAEIDAGIANANKIFVVNFFHHESLHTYIADKTYNEVNEAIENGKIITASLTNYDFGEEPSDITPNGPTYFCSGVGEYDEELIIFLSSQPIFLSSQPDSPTYVYHDIIALRNNDTIIRVTKTLNYA